MAPSDAVRTLGRSSGTWLARLRLAMFRLNWPETELMMGQYHSLLATWQVDAAESSALQMTGTVTARLPQVRLTQQFAGDWSVAGLVGLPNTTNLTSSYPLFQRLCQQRRGDGNPAAPGDAPVLPRLVGQGRLLRRSQVLHGLGRGRLAAQYQYPKHLYPFSF